MTDLQSFTLMMASAQVVETSVNTNNSPSQDYTTSPDDHSNHNNTVVIDSRCVRVELEDIDQERLDIDVFWLFSFY